MIRSGEVVVDDATHTAKVAGRVLDLTFKEFELLKFLAQHPGRVSSRQQRHPRMGIDPRLRKAIRLLTRHSEPPELTIATGNGHRLGEVAER